MKETNLKNQSKRCIYCGEYNGIVYNEKHILGEEPIVPCPQCIMPFCKCGGAEPYYYMENGGIQSCYCRDVRIRIDKIKRIYAVSGIDKKFKWKFLKDFKVMNKQGKDARSVAYNLINRFHDDSKGLFLWGNPGTGKTLLSVIVLTELICRYGITGRFVKISRNFFGLLRDTFNQASPNYGQSARLEREFHEVDALVLDDVGVQKDSLWEQETLYNLIDARYENQKLTIFTSNDNPAKTLRELSQGRILSRLKEMCNIMELSGNDMREPVQ